MSQIKRVGIIVDDYKLPKFKKELELNEIEISDQKPFQKGITAIFLNVESEKIDLIAKICKKCEIDVKKSN